jgi:hypothetical protein
MSRAAAPERSPIKREVPPHTTDAKPAAKVTLTVQPASIRGFQRLDQKVVTRLRKAKRPKESWVMVWAICPEV